MTDQYFVCVKVGHISARHISLCHLHHNVTSTHSSRNISKRLKNLKTASMWAKVKSGLTQIRQTSQREYYTYLYIRLHAITRHEPHLAQREHWIQYNVYIYVLQLKVLLVHNIWFVHDKAVRWFWPATIQHLKSPSAHGDPDHGTVETAASAAQHTVAADTGHISLVVAGVICKFCGAQTGAASHCNGSWMVYPCIHFWISMTNVAAACREGWFEMGRQWFGCLRRFRQWVFVSHVTNHMDVNSMVHDHDWGTIE